MFPIIMIRKRRVKIGKTSQTHKQTRNRQLFHCSVDTIATLLCFKTASATIDGRERLVSKVQRSVLQSSPVSNGQSNELISSSCFLALAEVARDLITSTGFSHTIGSLQGSRESVSRDIQPRSVSHEAPFSLSPLRQIPREGGDVQSVS